MCCAACMHAPVHSCACSLHMLVCCVHSSFAHLRTGALCPILRGVQGSRHRLSASSSAQLAAPWPHPKQKDEIPCGYLECIICGRPATPVSLIAPSAAALVPLYAPGVCLQNWSLPLSEFSFPAFPLPAIHHLPCQPMCILIACLLCLLMLVSTFLAEYLAASGTPYRLACVSIQVAWLHCGSATTLRSWSCIAAHTGALHPGIPTVVHFVLW